MNNKNYETVFSLHSIIIRSKFFCDKEKKNKKKSKKVWWFLNLN